MEIRIERANEFGEANEDDLDDFEEWNDVLLPDDYRDFIMEFNGGKPVPSRLKKIGTEIDWIYGFHNGPDWASIFFALDTYQGRLPGSCMPIAYDIAGNLIIMSLSKQSLGVVAFWDHENEAQGDAINYLDNVVEIADSFTDFLNLF